MMGNRVEPEPEADNAVNCRVLVVDDQAEIHDDFTEVLGSLPSLASDALAASFLPPRRPSRPPSFEVLHAMSGDEACEIVRRGRESNAPVAVAYVDVRMPPGMDGIETVRQLRVIDRATEVVLMTAYADRPLREIIAGQQLLHKLLYIRKPFAREEIQQVTLSLVTKWNTEQQLAKFRQRSTDSHRRLEAVLDTIEDAIGDV